MNPLYSIYLKKRRTKHVPHALLWRPVPVLLVFLFFHCTWIGSGKKWNNPYDLPDGYIPCIPVISEVTYDTIVSVGDTSFFSISTSCEDTMVKKYVWSFDNESSWDTTDQNENNYLWRLADTGNQTVSVFIINTLGDPSETTLLNVNVSAKRPHIAYDLSDTVVPQRAVIQKALLANDDDGEIVMYYWGTADSGWNDSTIYPTNAIITVSNPAGGPVHVRWAAVDNDGLFAYDTFTIFFNHGPDTILLLNPSLENMPVFDSYSIATNRGNITCSFHANDPDQNDTITYTFTVKNNSNDTLWSSTGQDTFATITNIPASTQLVWFLQATDAFGDSAVSSGMFVSPSPPSIPKGMVLIQGGISKIYHIGQSGFDSAEQPVHRVIFTNAFLIDSTEITIGQYHTLMDTSKGSIPKDSMLPISNVTWFDAVLYCNEKSKQHTFDTVYTYKTILSESGKTIGLSGLKTVYSATGFRLPTEAEWECACRQDSLTLYFWGNDIITASTYCWTRENSGNVPHPVASKKPSEISLYDMSGNVWEWCNDWFDPSYYQISKTTDPKGPSSGTEKVIRGGSFMNSAYFAQAGTRSRQIPSTGNSAIGFRTVLTIK